MVFTPSLEEAVSQHVNDGIISEIFERDKARLGFVRTETDWALPYEELKKAEERGGFKPGQVVYRFWHERQGKGVDFDDVSEVPYRALNSRRDADPATELAPGVDLKLPILSANMESVTGEKMLITMARMGGLGVLSQIGFSFEEQVKIAERVMGTHYNEPIELDGIEYEPSLDSNGNYLFAVARGIRDYSIGQARALKDLGVRIMCLDVAHAQSDDLVKVVYETKQAVPELVLIAGNVATAKGTFALFRAGADIVKVGVAQSDVCDSWPNTAVGVAQLSAEYRCALIAKEFGKKIIGDGGHKTGGRIVQGLAFGSGAVMLGTMLAATNDANLLGERIVEQYTNGTPPKVLYYGSASQRSKEGQRRPVWDASEGKSNVVLDYAGPTNVRLAHIDMWIRSGMSYAGRGMEESTVTLDRLQNHSRWEPRV